MAESVLDAPRVAPSSDAGEVARLAHFCVYSAALAAPAWLLSGLAVFLLDRSAEDLPHGAVVSVFIWFATGVGFNIAANVGLRATQGGTRRRKAVGIAGTIVLALAWWAFASTLCGLSQA